MFVRIPLHVPMMGVPVAQLWRACAWMSTAVTGCAIRLRLRLRPKVKIEKTLVEGKCIFDDVGGEFEIAFQIVCRYDEEMIESTFHKFAFIVQIYFPISIYTCPFRQYNLNLCGSAPDPHTERTKVPTG